MRSSRLMTGHDELLAKEQIKRNNESNHGCRINMDTNRVVSNIRLIKGIVEAGKGLTPFLPYGTIGHFGYENGIIHATEAGEIQGRETVTTFEGPKRQKGNERGRPRHGHGLGDLHRGILQKGMVVVLYVI